MEAANVKGRRRLPSKADPERTETRSADRSPRAAGKRRRRSRSRSKEDPRGRLDFTTGGESAYPGSSPSESQMILSKEKALEASAARPESEIPGVDIGPVEAEPALSPLVVVFIALLVILCLMWV